MKRKFSLSFAFDVVQMFLKNQELEMEEKALLVMGMPLRHYLMKYIFPTLTRGLVEVARLRPNDPIDFLVS